jgi:hypothetical protein
MQRFKRGDAFFAVIMEFQTYLGQAAYVLGNGTAHCLRDRIEGRALTVQLIHACLDDLGQRVAEFHLQGLGILLRVVLFRCVLVHARLFGQSGLARVDPGGVAQREAECNDSEQEEESL